MTKGIQAVLKKYKESVEQAEQAGTTERLILDSPNLNYNMGGGYPLGRIIELFGPESGGKSVLSWYIAKHIQRREEKNKVVIFDYERTFDSKYARTVGLDLDPEKLIMIRPLNGEEGFSIAQDLIETGEIGMMIIDSVAAIPSAKQIDADYGKATFGGTAALLSEGLRKLNPYISRYNIGMILINQVRDDIGGFSPVPGMKAEKTTGGRAVKFYSSWRGRVSRTQDIKIKGVVAGNGIKVKNVKNKVGPPKRVSEMVLYYDRGFDTMDEYINFIANEEFELADVKGAWIYGKDGSPLEGGKWQGRAKLRDHLESNPDVLEKCKVAIIDKFHENLASDVDPDEEEETPEVTDWAQYDE